MCVDCLMNIMRMLRASCGCFYGVLTTVVPQQKHPNQDVRRDQLSPDQLALMEKYWATYTEVLMGMSFSLSRYSFMRPRHTP